MLQKVDPRVRRFGLSLVFRVQDEERILQMFCKDRAFRVVF